MHGQFEEQKKMDIKQAHSEMSAKETLKQRMAEIYKAGAGNKESTPPSLTPM